MLSGVHDNRVVSCRISVSRIPALIRLSTVNAYYSLNLEIASIKNLMVSTVCLKKTGPLQLISRNVTNSQHSLIIFGPEIP